MNVPQLAIELKETADKTLTLRKILILLQKDESKSLEIWNINEIPIVILQIITESFSFLNTEGFTKEISTSIRLCLDLLCIMVKNQEIKEFFLTSQMDFYFYPFLMSNIDEEVKIIILKMFLLLFKQGLPESIKGSEILPLLLKIVDSNSDNLQYLALETLDLILIGPGLDYAVQTIDRFQAIDVVLSVLLKKSIFSGNVNFVKILLKIYLRMSEKPNVYQKLKEKIPEGLESKEMCKICEEDKEIKELRTKFLHARQ